MTHALLRATVLLVLGSTLALTAGCGGGGGSTPIVPGLVAQFAPSGATTAPNRVRIVSGGITGDQVTLNIVVGGPTTSADLYSFAFDLLLSDTTVATYVNGSARAGEALASTGVPAEVQVTQNGNRVIVGITRLGAPAGVRVEGQEEVLLSLRFRVLERDVTSITFAGSSINPQDPNNDPVALDSSGQRVTSIVFDPAAVQLSGA